jgi:aminoglycoside phosphotransferase (APT) family kinase protein
MSDNFRIVKKLNGHSGCEVDLCKTDAGYFIRKTSPGYSYNARLIRQAEKQERISGLIPVPAVLSSSFDKAVVFYDMEYVRGLDFKQMCLSRPMGWINRFVQTFRGHLERLQKAHVDANLPLRFQEKISSLQDGIYNHSSVKVRSLIPKLEVLYKYDYSLLPATESHGDMTLENIIFQEDGEIIFIDILDGELETFWMDVAKIVYDLEVSWSLREVLWESKHDAEARLLAMMSRYLHEEMMLAVATHFPDALPHLSVLKAIQALRVLPYSHNEKTVEKLADYVGQLSL